MVENMDVEEMSVVWDIIYFAQPQTLSRCSTYCIIETMREKMIRVNETELDALKEARDSEYPDYPLGAVIHQLAESTDN